MRWRLTIALVLISATAALSAPALADHDPGDCVPTCHVRGIVEVWDQPVVVVQAGSTVIWTTPDPYHTAVSEPAGPDDNACLDVLVSAQGDGSATFDIVDGNLVVKNQGSTEWVPCDEAVPLDDGAFILPYWCDIHRDPQRGALVIVPSAT